MKYLDLSGLTTFFSKLKDVFTTAHGNTTSYLESCVSNSVGAETVNQGPEEYYYEGSGRYRECKQSSAIGLENEQEYVQVETIIWSNRAEDFFSGLQIAYGDKIWFRLPNGLVWGDWKTINGNDGKLVKSFELSANATSFTIDDLDIDADGGEYLICVQYQRDNANEYALQLKLNNISSYSYTGTGTQTTTDSPYKNSGSSQSYFRWGASRLNYVGFANIKIRKLSGFSNVRFALESESYSEQPSSEHIFGICQGSGDENLTSLTFTASEQFVAGGTKVFVYRK